MEIHIFDKIQLESYVLFLEVKMWRKNQIVIHSSVTVHS